MKVFVVGATGLLGSQAAAELVKRGHKVRGLALPPLPEGAKLPEGMELAFGDYTKMDDAQLRDSLMGCDGLVFAAGVDERVSVKPPASAFYEAYNNRPLDRLLTLARDAGVRHAAVCGSYFAHFARKWPEENLGHHPYVKSRLEQEAIAMRHAGAGMDVAVLELPYIFGAQPGRRPVWVFLAGMLRRMKPFVFYPAGGTAAVTVRQVGEALAGALETNRGGNAIPLGMANLTWKRMLASFQDGMGLPRRPVVTVPVWAFALAGTAIKLQKKRQGLEGGLDLPRFARAMSREMFIKPEDGALSLGVTPDDIDAAIAQSARASADALDGKARLVGMQGEKN